MITLSSHLWDANHIIPTSHYDSFYWFRSASKRSTACFQQWHSMHETVKFALSGWQRASHDCTEIIWRKRFKSETMYTARTTTTDSGSILIWFGEHPGLRACTTACSPPAFSSCSRSSASLCNQSGRLRRPCQLKTSAVHPDITVDPRDSRATDTLRTVSEWSIADPNSSPVLYCNIQSKSANDTPLAQSLFCDLQSMPEFCSVGAWLTPQLICLHNCLQKSRWPQISYSSIFFKKMEE